MNSTQGLANPTAANRRGGTSSGAIRAGQPVQQHDFAVQLHAAGGRQSQRRDHFARARHVFHRPSSCSLPRPTPAIIFISAPAPAVGTPGPMAWCTGFSPTLAVQYYGQPTNTGNAKSLVKSASYQFTAVSTFDSDGDGVPDFVEIALGLDPTAGDSNGDGYSDLEALIHGISPTNSTGIMTNSRTWTARRCSTWWSRRCPGMAFQHASLVRHRDDSACL